MRNDLRSGIYYIYKGYPIAIFHRAISFIRAFFVGNLKRKKLSRG